MELLETQFELAAPLEEVFAFFAQAENLGRITPQELGFRILTPLPIEMTEGVLIEYEITLWGIRMGWRTRISVWDPPHRFVDEQLRGPYRRWVHTHSFAATPGGTLVTDRVEYELPLGSIGRLAHPLVRRQLSRIFKHRESRVRSILETS